ncbi:hypothetical protein QE152_g22049 [Popillia japonica]|uniref:Mutator-like transposase domain-containing protein n=1 Tax=Popillia japonica TaxID=7064 RepID=A0AAW1KJT6_POPJA
MGNKKNSKYRKSRKVHLKQIAKIRTNAQCTHKTNVRSEETDCGLDLGGLSTSCKVQVFMDESYEDDGGLVDNLTSRQLRANAEIKLSDNRRIGIDDGDVEVTLFSFLKFRGYSAIGTIRENRIPKECPLLDKRAFVKRDRGYFETAMERCDGHLFVRWMDNSVVTMISSSCAMLSTSRKGIRCFYATCSMEMEKAGKEELRLAKEAGDVDERGRGVISVFVDGAWCKRSHKTNDNASSGVAAIIGQRTKSLIRRVILMYLLGLIMSERKTIRVDDPKFESVALQWLKEVEDQEDLSVEDVDDEWPEESEASDEATDLATCAQSTIPFHSKN